MRSYETKQAGQTPDEMRDFRALDTEQERDPLTEDELSFIEQIAKKEGRPEVYGYDAIRMVAEIRRLRAVIADGVGSR